MADYPNGNGNSNGPGISRVRLAFFVVQLVLIGGFPLGAFLAEIYTPWRVTEVWERIYYLGIVIPCMVGQGLLRINELTKLAVAVADAARAAKGN